MVVYQNYDEQIVKPAALEFMMRATIRLWYFVTLCSYTVSMMDLPIQTQYLRKDKNEHH
jgi:hypothetical protein